MKRILLASFVVVSLSTSAQAQIAVGSLRCIFNGSLEIHAARQAGSPVIARVPCGASFLIMDNELGLPHIRLEDGKEGWITSQNVGQWSIDIDPSFKPDPVQPNTPGVTPAGIRSAAAPASGQIENRLPDFGFRRFDVGAVAASYNRQGSLNMYGGNLSFMTNINEHIGILADVALHESLEDKTYLTGGSVSAKGRVLAYRFGPRFYVLPERRASIFTELLLGGARVTGTGRVSSIFTSTPITVSLSYNGFAGAAGGGVDFKINPWLTWRTQADYSYLYVDGGNSHGVRTGTGVAFRFGRN